MGGPRKGFKVFLEEDLYSWLKQESAAKYSPMSAILRRLILDEIQRRAPKVAVLYKP